MSYDEAARGNRELAPSSSTPRAADVQLGGQAVIEGVMMRGPRVWVLAIREAGGEIGLEAHAHAPLAARHRLARAPVVRGLVALAESMRIGLRALAISAAARFGDEETDAEDDPPLGLTGGLVLAVAVAALFVLPAGVALLAGIATLWAFLALETLLRLAIFVGYVGSIGRSPQLRRTLEYHGAEHKAIACHEAGDALAPERAERHSRLHPRCGTSFLLVLMVVATAVLAPVGLPDWQWLLLSRVVAIPVAVGISYEVIRWMGRRRRSPLARALAFPGLLVQRLTTREPDRGQLEVAIAALERVLEDERAAGTGEGAAEMVA